MAYQTPPSSVRRSTLLTDSRKMPYYEDVYGKHNTDEEFDRFPDVCEEESSSEDEPAGKMMQPETPRGFFKAFTTPKSSSQPIASDRTRLDGTEQTHEDFPSSFQNFSKRRPASSSSSGLDTLPPSARKASSNLVVEETPSAISPTSRSTEHREASAKRLTPRKFGMFGTSASDSMAVSKDGVARKTNDRAQKPSRRLEDAMFNTAGEAMDDLLMSGGLGNLDDSFRTLEEDVNSAESAADDISFLISPAGSESAFDEHGQNSHGQSSIKKNAEAEAKAQEPKDNKLPTELVAVRQKKREKTAAQPARRKSLRQESLLQAKQTAERKIRRRVSSLQHSNSEVPDLKATNRRKMTARAATLRRNAKKGIANAVTSKPAQQSSRKLSRPAGVSIADRNWKRERMNATGAMVIVSTDEEDRSEYIRY